MAKIYLESGDNFVAASAATIYGNTGDESVSIQAGVFGIDTDSSVERVYLAEDRSAYTYGQKGVALEVYKNGGLITTFDSPDMQPIFNGVAVDIGYSAGVMDLGGTTISTLETPTEPLDTIAHSKSVINSALGASLSDANTFGVSTLDSGYHWDVNSKQITYSFNMTMPASYTGELTVGWTALNEEQKTATSSIIEGLNSLIGVSVEEVSSGGILRFNIIDMSEGTAGFAYQPGSLSNDLAGDIFFSSGFNSTPAEFSISVGGQGWTTIAHELGHAMGLDHPATGGVYGEQGKNSTTLETALDDTNHTIMSYISKDNQILDFTFAGNSLSYESRFIASDLYALYDVEALQAIYGVNTTTNTQDNIYSVQYTDYKTQTIWDAGGIDTIDLSSTLGSNTIDLNTKTAGTLNSADQYTFQEIVTLQQELVNNSYYNTFIENGLEGLNTAGTLFTGKNNLGIAQGVIIENINTGSGSDTITDNEVNNIISTYLGDDNIYLGHGGYDTVDGGGGNDTIFLDLIASQVDIEKQSDGSYILAGDNFAVNFTGIETIQYSDSTTLVIA